MAFSFRDPTSDLNNFLHEISAAVQLMQREVTSVREEMQKDRTRVLKLERLVCSERTRRQTITMTVLQQKSIKSVVEKYYTTLKLWSQMKAKRKRMAVDLNEKTMIECYSVHFTKWRRSYKRATYNNQRHRQARDLLLLNLKRILSSRLATWKSLRDLRQDYSCERNAIEQVIYDDLQMLAKRSCFNFFFKKLLLFRNESLSYKTSLLLSHFGIWFKFIKVSRWKQQLNYSCNEMRFKIQKEFLHNYWNRLLKQRNNQKNFRRIVRGLSWLRSCSIRHTVLRYLKYWYRFGEMAVGVRRFNATDVTVFQFSERLIALGNRLTSLDKEKLSRRELCGLASEIPDEQNHRSISETAQNLLLVRNALADEVLYDTDHPTSDLSAYPSLKTAVSSYQPAVKCPPSIATNVVNTTIACAQNTPFLYEAPNQDSQWEAHFANMQQRKM